MGIVPVIVFWWLLVNAVLCFTYVIIAIVKQEVADEDWKGGAVTGIILGLFYLILFFGWMLGW